MALYSDLLIYIIIAFSIARMALSSLVENDNLLSHENIY